MTMTTIIAALLAVLATGAASAQQSTFYDSSGKVVGRSSADSSANR